jgi:hypothetical protein
MHPLNISIWEEAEIPGVNLELFAETWLTLRASQSSQQAPFTFEIVGLILVPVLGHSCEKSQSTLVGFLNVLQFPPTGNVDGVG